MSETVTAPEPDVERAIASLRRMRSVPLSAEDAARLDSGRGAPSRKITTSVAKPRAQGQAPDAQAADIAAEKAAYQLRALVRRMTGNARTRGCGARCIRGDGVEVEIRSDAQGQRARWLGLMTCNHRWTCPVCARRIIARRRQQIIDAVTEGSRRYAPEGARWIMLTLTIRHHAGLPLRQSLRGLMTAWRKTRQRGTVQRAWRSNVLASARAVEVTSGANGWHPHLHVLVLTRQWDDSDANTLASTWIEMVRRELGDRCTPDETHGVHWSRAASDTYLAKLGLEMTGAAKDGSAWAHVERASESYALARLLSDPTEQARALARGDRHAALWHEYERATKGARAIELDDRAAQLARDGERLRLAEHGDSDMLAPSHSWSVAVYAEDLDRLRWRERFDRLALWRALRILERARGPDEARELLDQYIRSG